MNHHSATSPQICAQKMDNIRDEFPILVQSELGWGMSYLDNAATSLKPRSVIEAISRCYGEYAGPVHRGLYPLADAATAHYEAARKKTASFINAPSQENIVFTPSATQSINMVAQGWARQNLNAGDVIYVTRMEHHANYLPWQRVCKEKGAELKQIELKPDGSLDLEGASDLYAETTRLIALCHIGNVTGIQNPVEDICEKARAHGIPVMVDAAQSVAHEKIDVKLLDCDFMAFSAHKMYGPTGIGVLYISNEYLSELEPFIVGGGIVNWVGNLMEDTTFVSAPSLLEAGSQNLAGAVGLAAAIDYIQEIRLEAHDKCVKDLTLYARNMLSKIERIHLLPCPQEQQTSIISFIIDGVHPHDIAQTAGEMNVAMRAGHHCAQPLMQHFDIAATARASFSIYNNEKDAHHLIEAIEAAIKDFG